MSGWEKIAPGIEAKVERPYFSWVETGGREWAGPISIWLRFTETLDVSSAITPPRWRLMKDLYEAGEEFAVNVLGVNCSAVMRSFATEFGYCVTHRAVAVVTRQPTLAQRILPMPDGAFAFFREEAVDRRGYL